MEKLPINGIDYVKEKSDTELEYVIVRTYSAGVFAGYLESRNGKEVKLKNARRLWYWSGACSLSQLAQEGVKNPDDCKFAMPIDVTLTEAIEIISSNSTARKIIEGVAAWKK